MEEQEFSAMDAIQFAFGKFNEDAGYYFSFLGVIEVICLVAAITMSMNLVVASQFFFQLDNAPFDSYLYAFIVAYFVIRSAAQVVINRWFLMAHDGRRTTLDEMFGFDYTYHMPMMFKLIAASLVYSFYAVFGTLLFILPGLFATSTLRFYKFLIVERDADAVEGLRDSYELAGDHKGELVQLSLISTLMKAVGLCFFGVGYIPAAAVSGLAEAYAYKKLMHAYEQEYAAARHAVD